jgi:Tol biopolymer transport system component
MPAADVFLVDRQAGTTQRVSVNSAQQQADNQSDSSDGRFVAFRNS